MQKVARNKKVARNTKSCQKVAEQLLASPNFTFAKISVSLTNFFMDTAGENRLMFKASFFNRNNQYSHRS